MPSIDKQSIRNEFDTIKTHFQNLQFLSDMLGSLQYGNGLKAYIINLLICQMVALNRIQKLVKSMMGNLISSAMSYVGHIYCVS